MNDILDDLSVKGYHINHFETYELFEKTLQHLGTVFNQITVRYDPSYSSKLAGKERMELHTDYPGADMVAWYCFSQADRGGETLLFDFHKIRNFFSEIEKKILKIHIEKWRSHRSFVIKERNLFCELVAPQKYE